MATPTNLPAAATVGQVLTAQYVNDLRGAFRILQVIEATTTTIVTSSSATFVDTTLTATITPQSTTSKVFVLSNQSLFMGTAGAEMGFRLLRGSTTLESTLAAVFGGNSSVLGAGVFMRLDAPATTSAVTYKTQIARSTGSGSVFANINNNKGTMMLFEVSL
jgi:hypothetical protein